MRPPMVKPMNPYSAVPSGVGPRGPMPAWNVTAPSSTLSIHWRNHPASPHIPWLRVTVFPSKMQS